MAGKPTTKAANHLRAWRQWYGEERGRELTQTELGEMVGAKASVISEIESGKTQLGFKWLERFGRAFGVPMGYLLFDPYSANMAVLRAAMEVDPGESDRVVDFLHTFRRRA